MMANLFTLLALASMSSFAEAKTTTDSKGGYTLVVNDKTDKFSAATQQKFVDVFFNVYPKEVAEYNPKAPKKVNFVIDPEYHGVAAANGDTVRFDPSYFASHPKDIDVVTHEVRIIDGADKVLLERGAWLGLAGNRGLLKLFWRSSAQATLKGCKWKLLPTWFNR